MNTTKIKFNKKFLKYIKEEINIEIFSNKGKTKLRQKFDFQLEEYCTLFKHHLQCGLKLGSHTRLRSSVSINSKTNIGRYCSIANGVIIGLGSHPMNHLSTSSFFYDKGRTFKHNNPKELTENMFKEVNIGNDVWIGTNVMIMNGVNIGDGSVIGAGSVITRDVPPYAIVVGSNKIIKYRDKPEKFGKVHDWWNYEQADSLTYAGRELKPKILNKRKLEKLRKKYNLSLSRFIPSFL